MPTEKAECAGLLTDLPLYFDVVDFFEGIFECLPDGDTRTKPVLTKVPDALLIELQGRVRAEIHDWVTVHSIGADPQGANTWR